MHGMRAATNLRHAALTPGTKRVSMSDDSAAPTVAPSMAPSVMGRLGGESKQKLKVFIVTTVPRSDDDGTMQARGGLSSCRVVTRAIGCRPRQI